MRLSEYRSVADYYTGKTSDVTRQLILGGIAIVWLFKATDATTNTTSLPAIGIWPLITLSAAAMLDICQYFLGGLLWTNFYLNKEEELATEEDPDPEVRGPKVYGDTLQWIYYGKVILMIASYMLIVIMLAKELALK